VPTPIAPRPASAPRTTPQAQQGASTPARVVEEAAEDRQSRFSRATAHLGSLGLTETGQLTVTRLVRNGVPFADMEETAFSTAMATLRALTLDSPEVQTGLLRQRLVADLRIVFNDAASPPANLITKAFVQCPQLDLQAGITPSTATEGDWLIVADWAAEQAQQPAAV